MRVTVMVVGSTGDVRPMVALGVGLRAAGHQVRLATHAHFRELTEGQGLEFWPIAGNPVGELSTEAGRGWLASGANPVAFARLLGEMARDLAAGITRDCLAACTGSDAIVASLLGNALAWQVGEKLAVPVVPAYLQPRTPTSYYPDLFFPELFPSADGYAARPGAVQRLYHGISYRAVKGVVWRSLRESVNIGRDLLGLPRLGRGDPFGGALDAPRVLYGYSPLVAPAPPDWSPDAAVTGYWIVDDAAGWTPPPALADFLRKGEPPIYVGFGSMIHSTPEDTAGMVLSALAKLGRRGVVSAGWGGLRVAGLPDTVFALDYAPHEWLFPRVSAVVHHGGAGTTAAGLRAGKPSVITPFFADQNFWGRRVHALGAGPRPVPVRRLSTEKLAAAIDSATRSPDMRRRAEDLGCRLREEKGVERAVAALERMVREWPGWDRVRRREARNMNDRVRRAAG